MSGKASTERIFEGSLAFYSAVVSDLQKIIDDRGLERNLLSTPPDSCYLLPNRTNPFSLVLISNLRSRRISILKDNVENNSSISYLRKLGWRTWCEPRKRGRTYMWYSC